MSKKSLADNVRKIDFSKSRMGTWPAKPEPLARPTEMQQQDEREYLINSRSLHVCRMRGVYGEIYEVRIEDRVYRLVDGRVEMRVTGRYIRQLARYVVGRDQWGTLHAHFIEFINDIFGALDRLRKFHGWLDHFIRKLPAETLDEVFAVIEAEIRGLQPVQV